MCILTYMLSNELYQSVTINKTEPLKPSLLKKWKILGSQP